MITKNIHRSLPVFIGVAALAMFAASCGSPASGLNIEEFDAITVTEGTDSATCATGTAISQGRLFTNGLDHNAPAGTSFQCCGYLVGVELRNELPTQADSNVPQLTVDQHEIIVQTVTTNSQFIPSSGGTVVLASETFPVAAIIPSGGSFGSFLAPILSVTNGGKLSQRNGELIITVSFSGHTRDGTPIATPSVNFPIEVIDDIDMPCPTPGAGREACDPTSASQPDGYLCSI